VPQSLIGAARKNFDPSVSVHRNSRIAGDAAAQRGPGRPWAAMRRSLPDVPQRVVVAADKHFKSSVGVHRNSRLAGDATGE